MLLHTTPSNLSATTFLPKALFPSFQIDMNILNKKGGSLMSTSGTNRPKIQASLIESPVLWAGRVCIQYAILKAGWAGSPANPIVLSELGNHGGDDLGFSR